MSSQGQIVLWGDVVDHPILGTASIITSQLIAIDPAVGWARTASRWYQLGRPVDAKQAKMTGFTEIDDLPLLALLLEHYIARVREIDAADRSAADEEV